MDSQAHDVTLPVRVGCQDGMGNALDVKFAHARLAREHETMRAMLSTYCCDEHGTAGDLCPECRALLDYATVRLERCRFQADKPTCAKCPVHCYGQKYREQVKVVMRQAGPQMLWHHPILSIRHLLDGRRPVPTVS